MVVVAGVTDCVPPVLASGYDEPSVPVITTVVALVAVTVSVAGRLDPAVIVVGFALMVTVGAGGGGGGGGAFTVTVALAVAVPDVPVTVIV